MGNPFGALEAAAERRSPCRQRRKSPSARRNSRRAGAVGQKRGFAALSAAERQRERANRQHARRDAPGESARKFPPQRRRQARRAKARSPCRQRRTPGRTPQQRDRRRMREERTGRGQSVKPTRARHVISGRRRAGAALTHATPTSEETR